MEIVICGNCGGEVANVGLKAMKMSHCHHWVHTACLKNRTSFKQCDRCTGTFVGFDINEPNEWDGRDYLAQPPEGGTWIKRGEPFIWFKERKPLTWISKQYGLQRLLAAGVDVEDFVGNGYTWKQMKEAFKDFNACGERAIDGLVALGCNGEHLRDYGKMMEGCLTDLSVTQQQLVEKFGFAYDDEGLKVVNGKNQKSWTGKEAKMVGLTKEGLMLAGLKTPLQFASFGDDTDFGVTMEDLGLGTFVVAAAAPPPQMAKRLEAVSPIRPKPIIANPPSTYSPHRLAPKK